MNQLINQPFGIIYQVQKITGDDKTKKYLQQLGISMSNRITLIKLDKHMGILSIRNSRIAVSRELLENIWVDSVNSSKQYIPLNKLNIGDNGLVVSVYGEGAIRRRLMDMGVTKNVSITIRKVAPLGDPIEVTLRNYELTLRKEEAALILVTKEEVL
ncbi:ferrous iron transport protein A [Enterococcus saccharolyticus]|uniref:FeoA family protein n=1 Tax=Enterococcus TaxID=1350 RepID=UPI001E4DB851|nr:FeoA domain-containing protein [Enterococcus saccharolyticus]MCD5003654.1 ferrous iron transport protein A [Enterococcus saccharolyticus]